MYDSVVFNQSNFILECVCSRGQARRSAFGMSRLGHVGASCSHRKREVTITDRGRVGLSAAADATCTANR